MSLHRFFLSPKDPETPPQSPMTKMWCKPLLSSRKQAFLSSEKNDSQIPFKERKSETQRREVCRKSVFQLQSHRIHTLIHTYGQPRCGNSTPLRSVAKSGGFCEQARKALQESQSLHKVSMSLDMAPFRMCVLFPSFLSYLTLWHLADPETWATVLVVHLFVLVKFWKIFQNIFKHFIKQKEEKRRKNELQDPVSW